MGVISKLHLCEYHRWEIKSSSEFVLSSVFMLLLCHNVLFSSDMGRGEGFIVQTISIGDRLTLENNGIMSSLHLSGVQILEQSTVQCLYPHPDPVLGGVLCYCKDTMTA